MKKIFFLVLILLSFSSDLTNSLYAQLEESTKITSSSFGIIAGYNESIVRDARSYYYPYNYYKEEFPEKFRGYTVGVSYNNKLEDNGGFGTLTIEALLQTLPMFYDSYYYIEDTMFYDYYPSKMVSNQISNLMVTVNGLYNINLFNSGFAFSFGGSIAYNLNNHYKKTLVVDSIFLTLIESNIITPLEPVEFGKEIEITPENRKIDPVRVAMILGLNYNFSLQTLEIEPFLRYSHSFTIHSNDNLDDLFLHGFQTGLSVRFPL